MQHFNLIHSGIEGHAAGSNGSEGKMWTGGGKEGGAVCCPYPLPFACPHSSEDRADKGLGKASPLSFIVVFFAGSLLF